MNIINKRNIEELFCVKPPKFECTDFFIRYISFDDWEDLVELYQNKYLHMYCKSSYLYSEKMAMILIDDINSNYLNRKGISWVVIRKIDSEIVGMISLSNISVSDKSAEIGYVVKEKEMYQKIMSNVLPVFIDNIFNYNFIRIEANVCTENIPSVKLLKKIGFEEEGKKRKCVFNIESNKYLDSYIFSKIQ